jgi:hypothetical protein
MTNLSTYRTLPRWALVVRFALVGFFAGFFAWVLVFGLRLLAGDGGPPSNRILGAPQKISVTAFGRKRPVIMAKSERLVSARKPPVE